MGDSIATATDEQDAAPHEPTPSELFEYEEPEPQRAPAYKPSPPVSSGWFRIDNDALDRAAEVGPVAFTVFCVLSSHANAMGVCWPSVAKIALKVGVTERSARRSIRALESSGMIETKHRRDETGRNTSSTYKLLTIPPREQADTNDSSPGHKRQGDGDTDDSMDGDTNDGVMGTQAPVELDPLEQHPIEQHPMNNTQ